LVNVETGVVRSVLCKQLKEPVCSTTLCTGLILLELVFASTRRIHTIRLVQAQYNIVMRLAHYIMNTSIITLACWLLKCNTYHYAHYAMWTCKTVFYNTNIFHHTIELFVSIGLLTREIQL